MKDPNISRSVRQSQGLQGFTLLELLLAVSLSMVLFAMLFSVMQGVLNNFSRSTDGVIQSGDASAALDQMILDLQSMVTPNGANEEALRVTNEMVAGAKSAWMTLLTAAIDRDNSESGRFDGTPRAVSYRLAYQNPIDGSSARPVFALYRSIASAQHTFDQAIGLINLQQEYWDKLSGEDAPPSPTAIKAFFVGNVAELQLRFRYIKDVAAAVPEYAWTETGDEIVITGSKAFRNGMPVPGGFSQAEVELTILSTQGSALVEEDSANLTLAKQRFSDRFVRQSAIW